MTKEEQIREFNEKWSFFHCYLGKEENDNLRFYTSETLHLYPIGVGAVIQALTEAKEIMEMEE